MGRLACLTLALLLVSSCDVSTTGVGGEGKPCFSDGTCESGLSCNSDNICEGCHASCTGRQCGDDGCGGSCGACPSATEFCNQSGQCIDDCNAKECGASPNEGFDCGACSARKLCIRGRCEELMASMTGGSFDMGSESGGPDERPVHYVTLPPFEIMKTEVTMEQYRQCVIDGACSDPDSGRLCNWNVSGHGAYPINCVDWYQAAFFCGWAGGRLPSEAEWEYAARSGGRDMTYPWGDDSPTCSLANYSGCEDETWTVCTAAAGNTSQGLCDMAGNALEWVQDWYHDDYSGAPSDGSAWESPPGDHRVLRGGSWFSNADNLRSSIRFWGDPSRRDSYLGFRCAR